MDYGYALSSEEHPPLDLVRNARRAEQVGFSFALVSDHFHPWLDAQGQSPFVWSVIGGIAQATERIRLGTGVTCALVRTHPAVVAHAAATCAAMMPGRFFLGVGTGENLNEHVLGDRWPAPDERLELLEEAVGLIRELWRGDTTTHRGRRYTVDRARIYTLPGAGRRRATARVEIAYEVWPNSALAGSLNTELATPEDFAGAVRALSKEEVAKTVTHGPDVGPYVDEVRSFAEAGFDHVYLHQVGRDQEGFLRFWEQELRPALEREL